ncbi:acyltransferase [Paraburkholderia diazotrophica]|uniref:acyltransferase family protein n=1 Tax=Paraburkholderia diazotrophica TaxID=667676 RepID=UPI003180484E
MKYRLQYLRAIAAFMVVVWHASYHLWNTRADNSVLLHTPGISGAFGVTLFFVISGYLMATLAGKNSAGQFFLHRVIRIYPVYWIVVLLFFFGSSVLGYGFTFDLASFLLLPGPGRIYPLGVEWTLPFELSFYLVVFFIVLFRATRAVPVIAALWALGILAVVQFAPGISQGQFPRLSHLLVSQWTLAFALGMLVPTIIRYGIVSSFSWLLGLAIVASAAVFPQHAAYLLPAGCLCLVHWAVIPRPEGVEKAREIKWLTRLGDWSYALYLCHVPIMLWIFRLAPAHWSGSLLWVASIVLSLLGAALIGRVDLWLYRRLKGIVDGFSKTTCARLGPAVAACLVAYSGHAEVRAWSDSQLAARADELGHEISRSQPVSLDALADAAQRAHLVPAPELVGHADSLTCGADGVMQIRGWAADREAGSGGIAVLVFQGGGYRGSALPKFARADVVQVLKLSRLGVTPGFEADVGTHNDTSAGCSQPVLLVVKDSRFALLPVDSHFPAPSASRSP